MQPIRPGEYRAPINKSVHFTVTTPPQGTPMYSTTTVPPGTHLHPCSQEFVPNCSLCGRIIQRKNKQINFVCSCINYRKLPLAMPTTAVHGLYPLTYAMPEAMTEDTQSFEPLVLSHTDLIMECHQYLQKKHRPPTETIRFISDRVTDMIRNALTNKPHIGGFNAKESDTLLAMATIIADEAADLITECKPIPLSMITSVFSIQAFIETTSKLMTALTIKATVMPKDYTKHLATVKMEAYRLYDMLQQAEITAVALKASLPVLWCSHPLITIRQWFVDEPTADSTAWLTACLDNVNNVLQSDEVKHHPTTDHFGKIADNLTHVTLFAIRTLARVSRITFEVRCAREAQEYWNDHYKQFKASFRSPLSNPFTPSMSPPNSVHSSPHTGLYPHVNTQPQQPSPRAHTTPSAGSQCMETDVQLHQGQSNPSAPTSDDDGSYPRPPYTQVPDPPSRPVTLQPNPQMTELTRQISRTRSAFNTNLAQILTLILLIPVLAGAPIPSRNDSTTTSSVGQTFNVQSSPQYTIPTGKIVKDNFIYEYKGPRIINPHTKLILRQFDTDFMARIGPTLKECAAAMLRVCDHAKKLFYTTDNWHFETIRAPADRFDALSECSRKHMVPATITGSEDGSALNKFMKKTNLPFLLAPIIPRPNPAEGVMYIDSTPIPWNIFENVSNATISDITKGIHDLEHYRILYFPGVTTPVIAITDCQEMWKESPHMAKAACTDDIRFPCKNLATSFVEKNPKETFHQDAITSCHERVDQMTHEAITIHAQLAAILEEKYDPKVPINAPVRPKRSALITGIFAATGMGSLIAIINSGINKSRIEAINKAMDTQQMHLNKVQLATQENRESLDDLAKYLHSIGRRSISHERFTWYQSTTTILYRDFSTNVQNAGIASNRLAAAILSKQVGKVNPTMLTTTDLNHIATNIYATEGLTLSTDMDNVVPDVYSADGQIWASFEIPIHSADRQFDLFTVTPIPVFSEKGNRIVPVNPTKIVAFQQNGEGFIPMTEAIAKDCLDKHNVCYSPTPIMPVASATCAIAPFRNRPANCTYEETTDDTDFFHTTGNFTCFSVKRPTQMEAYCPSPDQHQSTMLSQTFTIQEAGCFTFRQLCLIKTHHGQTLLPSSQAGRPYTMPSRITMGSNAGLKDVFDTITEFTPSKILDGVISTITSLAPKDVNPLPSVAEMVQSHPIYDLLIPGFTTFIAIMLVLLLISIGISCCFHQNNKRYKSLISGITDRFEAHEMSYLDFTRGLFSFASQPASRRQSVSMQNAQHRPPSALLAINEQE